MCISRRRHALRAPGRDIPILLTVLLAADVVSGPARTLLPVYLEQELAWGPPAIAALAAARLIAGAFSAPLGGILSDRTGPRRTLRLGLAGLPLAALVFLTPTASVLLLLAPAVGLAEGLQATGSQTYLVARADRATIGVAAGAFFTGGTWAARSATSGPARSCAAQASPASGRSASWSACWYSARRRPCRGASLGRAADRRSRSGRSRRIGDCSVSTRCVGSRSSASSPPAPGVPPASCVRC